MKKQETGIEGLYILEPNVFHDDRGFFYESYNKQTFSELGIDTEFVQDNHSQSKKGVLRGLHYQSEPHALVKLVRCTKGKLYDVAVDIRKESPTYLKWFGIELSEENQKMLYIPEGFLHGFYSLEDCELQYKVSDYYFRDLDGSIAWDDEEIGIDWPFSERPDLSEKDKNAPMLKDADLVF